MAYDELFADRIRKQLAEKKAGFYEKKMFGGLCFMVDDKMCLGIIKNKLMVRIDPEDQEQFLAEENVRQMDFTHRPMNGFLYVEPEGTDLDEDLEKWVDRCLSFNPKANSSKKKKSS